MGLKLYHVLVGVKKSGMVATITLVTSGMLRPLFWGACNIRSAARWSSPHFRLGR